MYSDSYKVEIHSKPSIAMTLSPTYKDKIVNRKMGEIVSVYDKETEAEIIIPAGILDNAIVTITKIPD